MKKWISYLCVVLLAFGLAACGRDAESGDGSKDTQQSSSQETSSSEEGDSQEDVQGSQEQPGGDTGASDNNYEEGWSQEMEALKAAVVQALGEGNYWPDMAMLPDMLEMSFSITSDMYEDYMAEMPMISANVDTLLIVKAKEGKLEAVQSALEAYREAQVGNTMQYPMNVGKVQASRVETIGDYVIYVQLGGDTTGVDEKGDEAVIAHCQEANDAAVEAIHGQLEGGLGG